MTQTRFGERACQNVREKLDSYVDNELLTETNLELMGHFQRCTACTQEAQERRNARGRLRTAVRELQVPVGLEKRVRDRLRRSREPQAKKFHLMAIAATLAICFGSWAAYKGARSSSAVAALMRVGLGDHVHCAVIRQAASPAQPTVDKLPANYKELIPIVRQRVPPNLPLVLAHECHYQGRKFVHLTFRNNRNLLSLVITPRQNGESLGAGVHSAGVNQYQGAAFESGNFLVYAISDLPHQGNLAVLVALASDLHNFLNQMGA